MTQLIWSNPTDAIAHCSRTAHAPLTWDTTEHLLSRLSFGPTAADRAYVALHGVAGWYNNQVTVGTGHLGYTGNTSVAALGTLLGKTPYDVRLWLKQHGGEYGWTAMDQLSQVTLGLQAWSSAQLYEVLVDFFANHFNVANHNGDVWNTRHAYDRDVIRKYAMADFTSMLIAASKHPAMLAYLNLGASTKEEVNENYGREVLEVHTVGLRYSETDVKNAAALLTGRTLTGTQHYAFDPDIHPLGKITVLEFAHDNADPAQGEAAGDALLTYLATHPYTATNLARKLCVRLVSDDPSPQLIAAVADAYLKSHTQILPMVNTIICSTEFWDSRGAKVRRPAENVIATVRALQPNVVSYADATQTLHWITGSMGNCPLDWAYPNGYPDVATAWRSAGALLTEWNTHLGIAGGWWTGLGSPTLTALYGNPATSGDAIKALTKSITGMTFSAAHLSILQTFVGEPATTVMSKSKLRWLAPSVIALILDAPHFALC